MRTHFGRLIVPVGLVLSVAACGGGADADEPPPPGATFTATDHGCDVATNGWTYDAGRVEVEFVNDLDTAATIEVLDPSGAVAAGEDLDARQTVPRDISLDAGEYTLRCSADDLTWSSTGQGQTPSGVMTGSDPYRVGS